MDYQEFISAVNNCKTSHVQAIFLIGSCYPKPIPSEVIPLFVEIIKIIHLSKPCICAANEVIKIFGIQAAPFSFESNYPLLKNRIFYSQEPLKHLSCCIQYYIKYKNSTRNSDITYPSKSFFVDFTTGEVADDIYYSQKLFKKDEISCIYGQIDEQKLSAVWLKLHKFN